ncbi:hypothetical protein UCDDA912_g01185 [Diaporthe ampelina]|uniref:Uncharacterized protein n=1 Tax=Diaporthe ampelina TaxID=1214573 RepID=A0A0G2HVP0_9PEZI|nr:hypothetical protein UCDDA912_g01185 [Diaporthe ampelina]
MDEENGEGRHAAAEGVAVETDQLENEVIHFMNISFAEKEKAEALSGRLAFVTQEKEDLERRIDELDRDLSRTDWQAQEDVVSATDAGDTMSRVHAKITKLRATAQSLENEFNVLNSIGNEDTKTIADLKKQLRTTGEQLAQKTQEGERLREELEQTTRAAGSEKTTNEGLLYEMETLKQECNMLRSSYASTGKKLAEAEQTADTLSGFVKRKVAESEGVRKAGAAQAQAMRQEIDGKQKQIESLVLTQKILKARCHKAEAALQQQLRPTHQHTKRGETDKAARSQRDEKDAVIKKLADELRHNQERRVRAVAIGIDLSGSAAGSLTEGIKKVYAHLLGTLQRSPCQTYVMTAVHGPGDAVAVKSRFADTWATHDKVLEGQKADGVEQHVECLRKMKEVAVSTGLVLDLQAVLLGDSKTNHASHVGAEEVCADFAASNPTVHIHSVAVKTGSAEETETYWNNLEAWHPWNYASATGGNMIVWWQDSPLPDLSSLVY